MTLSKPAWWDDLALRYGFSNDASATIAEEVLIDTLNDYVRTHASLILSPEFLAAQASVIRASSSVYNESNILVAETGALSDLMIGYGAADYLAGRAGDDILHGGNGNDYFSPGSGIDLVIGGDETGSDAERDTVGYLGATSGVTVDAPVFVPGGGSGSGDLVLQPGQDYYAYSYADWLDPAVPKIYGFQTGPGGDYIDISALLSHIGYTGTDPVATGHLRFATVTGGMKIQFDADGVGGAGPRELVRLMGVTVGDFSVTHNLIKTPVTVVHPQWRTDDFALASDDGQGGYDVLYSIENIMGSDFADTLHGQQRAANILLGGLGNDSLYGEGGDDILAGGAGRDTLWGGEGADILLVGSGGDQADGGAGADVIRFEGAMLGDLPGSAADIYGFQTGAGGDRIDLSEILYAGGYAGANAVADGRIAFQQDGADLRVLYDRDGAGAWPAQTVAVLHDVAAGSFSVAHNLVANPADKGLLVCVMGQSNAMGLRVFGDDNESGLTRLYDGLDASTDFARVTMLPQDEYGNVVSIAVGGSRVDGDTEYPVTAVWWYPDQGKPGEILIRAVEALGVQIAEQRARGALKPVVVWGQGESDAILIGDWTTSAQRDQAQQRYMDATRAIFDYIKDRLGDDIEFYLMQTGRYSIGGALALGTDQDEINRITAGLPYIQKAQEILAETWQDVHLAVNYSDLPMNYEVTGAPDEWHYHPEQRETIGDRIADFLALDLGYDFVLDNPGNYPIALLDDLDLAAGPGAVRAGNLHHNIVVGTLGNDTLSGGAGGNDVLYGGAGDDAYVLTSGVDTVRDRGGYDRVVLDFALSAVGAGALTTLVSGFNLRLVIDGGLRDLILSGQLGADSARHIEALQFTDATLSLAGAQHWQFAPAAGGTLTGDQGAVRDDTLFGGAGNDILRGLEGNDGLYGFGGVDDIYGGGGNDTIRGGDGDDLRLRGEGGNDTIYGDDGNDDARGGDGDDTIYGGAGHDRVEGENGNDTLYGDDGDDMVRGRFGNDVLYGGTGTDDLRGQEDNDTLYGGDGNDALYGGMDLADRTSAGTDALYGEAGDDRLYGAGDADWLEGGAGADRLWGGAGADTFAFAGPQALTAVDRIHDFSLAEGDRLDLSGLLDLYDPLTMAITAFVEITTVSGNSVVKVDIDGAGAAQGFVQIATIDRVVGLTDEAALVASGNLVV